MVAVSLKKKKIDKKSADMSIKELREKIRRLKRLGIDPIELSGELNKRISSSFAIIPFIILGLGISLLVKHREKSINFSVAFISAFSYYVLFILGETLLRNRIVSPFLGMWIPNIVITLIGVLLFYKNAHFR